MTELTCQLIVLGRAPMEIVHQFGLLYQHSLTESLIELLKRAPRKHHFAYKFQAPSSYLQWEIPLLAAHCTEDLKNVLSRLDDFVWTSRLDSRAAAIEMLMFHHSGSQDIGVQTDDDDNCAVDQKDSMNGEVTTETLKLKIQDVISNAEKSPNVNTETAQIVTETRVAVKEGSEICSYSCEECHKTFKTHTSMERHAKLHSSSKRRKTCNYCHKSFSSNYSVVLHERIHSGEKPYICEMCGRTFTQRQDLENHNLTHSEKRYTCEKCGLNFTLYRGLRDHMRLHSGERPFVCDVCGRAYIRQCNLSEHMTVHTGAKPYKCKFCSKTFRKSCSRVKHERIHNGVRPFTCALCSKTFTQKYNLNVHMRTHSKPATQMLGKLTNGYNQL